MFAVPLARLGHDVTVVDPSADALATLRRRADTAGVGDRVRGVRVTVTCCTRSCRPPARGRDRRLRPGPLPLRPRGRRRPRGHPPGDRRRPPPRRSGESRDGQPRRRRPRPGRRRSPGGGAGPARGPRPASPAAGPGAPPVHPGGHARPRRGRRPAARPVAGVSVVADLLEATSGAAPHAVRALELALAEASPFRDIATGLHVMAARP